MSFGDWVIDAGMEALLTGAWLVVVPSLVLVLLATSVSLDTATLRRAWFGCLLCGFGGILLGLAGGIPFGIRWEVPGPVEPGWIGWALLAVYLSGVFWILGRALLGWLALQRWTGAARAVYERRVVDAFEVGKAALGIRNPCYLLTGREIPSPFSVGLVNHRVLLPSDLLEELDDEELRDLALHEMAHVARRDPTVFALAVLAKALFWPNPLVWVAVHQLKLNAEKVADEAVVSVTEEVKPYSRLLLKMSERTTRGAMVPLAAGVYLHKSFFIQRAEALVAGMLTGGHPTGSPLLVWSGLFLGAGGALAFGPAWAEADAGFGDAPSATASMMETIDPPVESLLRDGLFFDETWVRLEEEPEPGTTMGPTLDSRWLGALGLNAAPTFIAYRHLYEDDGGKQSMFAFETDKGGLLFLVLVRGEDPRAGQWKIGRNGIGPETMESVQPNSEQEQAIVQLLRSWPEAALGSEEEWRALLREWPDLPPGSVEDAAVMMGESLETFRELRLHGDVAAAGRDSE